MPRIGIDARLTYYRQGGIAQYTYALIHELAGLDRDNDTILLHSRKDSRDLSEGPRQHRARVWTPAHHRFERLALGLELTFQRLDLLHSPDFIPPAGGAKHYVITVHDLAFLLYPDILTAESRRYYNDQIGLAVKQADAILAVSEATRADLIELVGAFPDKITVTPEAAGEQFHPASQQEILQARRLHDLPESYLFFLGTYEPRKNLGGLLRAYAEVVADTPDAPPLVIAGRRGWLYKQIFTLAETLKLGRRVIWLENPADKELAALYSGATGCCFPSFYEGFGLPALEAMACGTPVLVSNRGALPEVVGDAGIQVNPDDPFHIADGIRRLLSHSELIATLRAKGLDRAAAFSWRRMAEQTLSVYSRLLGS